MFYSVCLLSTRRLLNYSGSWGDGGDGENFWPLAFQTHDQRRVEKATAASAKAQILFLFCWNKNQTSDVEAKLLLKTEVNFSWCAAAKCSENYTDLLKPSVATHSHGFSVREEDLFREHLSFKTTETTFVSETVRAEVNWGLVPGQMSGSTLAIWLILHHG